MVYENGIQLPQSQAVAQVSSKESGTISNSFPIVLDNTKNYELRITNTQTSQDVTVCSASLTVERLT